MASPSEKISNLELKDYLTKCRTYQEFKKCT